MTWRLSDLPIEARLAAERAAEAEGRTLDAWVVAMVRASLTRDEARPVRRPPHPKSRPPEPRDQVPLREATPETAAAPPPLPPVAVMLATPGRERVAAFIVERAVGARRQPALPAGPVSLLPLAALKPPPHRLRRGGDETALAALAVEIEVHGVRDPVLVRRTGAGIYEIVAGERRRLAAERAGKAEIPAIVVEADDGAAQLLSLAENIDRGDFTPLDEARAYLRLLTEYRISPGMLANRLSIGRPHIASSLRLLGLPQRARQAIESGRIGAKQAYQLLDSADPDAAVDRLTVSNDKP